MSVRMQFSEGVGISREIWYLGPDFAQRDTVRAQRHQHKLQHRKLPITEIRAFQHICLQLGKEECCCCCCVLQNHKAEGQH